jgi:predicted ATPase
MKIRELRLCGIRCFEDTGDIQFDPKCNIFVGKNNARKSSVLRAILGLQGFPFNQFDIRPGHHDQPSFVTLRLEDVLPNDNMMIGRDPSQTSFRISTAYQGNFPGYNDATIININAGQQLFPNIRPQHSIVPFLARRKAAQFTHDVSTNAQSALSGTLSTLYSRIDLLATYGHSGHDRFCEAVKGIVGLPITMRASGAGKEAGFYFDDNTFVTLERMGDGVSEMVALIVELCTEKNKIFVLEEPETNLHPSGLKALLAMIRTAPEHNQFFIGTHSNIVVRELGGIEAGKVFRVFCDGQSYTSSHKIEEVESTPAAHMELLRELGYEFTDFDLYGGWLFLEESSAERIIREILVPMFASGLRGRLRTYSAGGATNLEPSVSEFQRLVVFVHLQPVYENRLWIRADADEAGVRAVEKIRVAFPHLSAESLSTFSEEQFELYYPPRFQETVKEVLAITDKQSRRKRKGALLQDVLNWTNANWDEGRVAWEASAKELIEFLQLIQTKLAAV